MKWIPSVTACGKEKGGQYRELGEMVVRGKCGGEQRDKQTKKETKTNKNPKQNQTKQPKKKLQQKRQLGCDEL